MISEKMVTALNEQINAEYYSSYLYLGMAAYFESEDLEGFAHWMKLQAQEELSHAMKIFDQVLERGSKVVLKPLDGSPTEWDSPLTAFKAAYEHEKVISGKINDLVNQAISEGDHATNSFLQWFVSEQVEEEASAEKVVNVLSKIGGSVGGLYQLDHRLGHRQ